MPTPSPRHVLVPFAALTLLAGLSACRGEDQPSSSATSSGPI
jgi:hypothetical protein